jgi:hypothetical protein
MKPRHQSRTTVRSTTTRKPVRMGAGKWAIDLTLIPGSYEYRLVVDGNWMADPNASHSVPNPFGEPNSLLVVPHRRRSMGSEAQESP